jgi:hypothetical protein
MMGSPESMAEPGITTLLISVQNSYDEIHQSPIFARINSRWMLVETRWVRTGPIYSTIKAAVTIASSTTRFQETALGTGT